MRVRKFFPEVRLRRMVNDVNGLLPSDAIDRAAMNLEDIRDNCLAAIDEKIAAMTQHARSGGTSAREACYVLANEVFAEAGVFGLDELSSVAHGLCALLSGARTPPPGAINVYLDAMKALRRPAVSSNKLLRRAVLSELDTLSRHFAPDADCA